MKGEAWLRAAAAAIVAVPLLSAGIRFCTRAPEELARGGALEPRSVRGVLRASAYASDPVPGGPEPLRHVTVYVNGPDYAGMEDNDLRGFLDGRFKFGWNQATQVHVRLGRRPSTPRYGEQELFRVIQRWAGIELPPAARVHRAALDIAIEKGPGRDLQVLLYAVRKDWNPGEGGLERNNNSPPREGEVWWVDRARGSEPWGLPGAGFASDTHPLADTDAMPLAEAGYAAGRERLRFTSPALAAYAERRVRAGLPLLYLIKLADHEEDSSQAFLVLHSGNRGDTWNSELRPRLTLEWDSPAEVARLERTVHLEHGRTWTAPPLEALGATRLAASFAAEPGHEAPTLELREPAGAPSAWRRAALPIPVASDPVELRLVAARNPIALGEVFRATLRDTWIETAPPDEQRVRWTFVGPAGERHVREAGYAGDYRFEVEFRPPELGRWAYFYEHDFDGPYLSPVGRFDVLGGDRENVEEQLRALLSRIREARRDSDREAVARLGGAFRRLERAALAVETPESFRGGAGRETFDLLTAVREALAGEAVPDHPEPRALAREW